MKRVARLVIVLLAALLALPLLEQPASALPPQPTPVSPLSGDTVSSNPTFKWQPIVGATSYRLQVATNSSFGAGTVIVDVNTVNTAFVPTTDLQIGSLSWHVQASDNSGTGPFSTTQTFTKSPNQAPNPTSPADTAVLSFPTQPLILSWDPLVGASIYQVEIGLDPLFSTILPGYPVGTYQTSYTLTQPPTFGQTLYWHVRGFSSSPGSQPSSFSAARSFSVTWGTKPTLTTPPNTNSPAVEDFEFAWNWVEGATSYDIQVSPDINFNSLIIDGNVRSTRLARNPHLANAAYYWRVRARAGSSLGPWSDVWTFTKAWPGTPFPTSGTSSRVQLTYPADGAVVTVPTLRWTPFRKAAQYEVQVSGDPTFTTFANCYTNHTEITVSPNCLPGIQPSGFYYWRVRPIDNPSGTNGLFSPLNGLSLPYSFSWQPTVVNQTSPTNGQTIDNPILSWDPGQTGRYRVFIASAANDQIIQTVDTYNTSFVFQQKYDATPGANNTYRWWVSTLWTTGPSAAPLVSSWRTFTIGAPGSTSPQPDPIGSPQTYYMAPLLRWNRVAGANSYIVYISPQGQNSWTALAGTSQPAYAHLDQSIQIGAYDWRVEARDVSNVLISQSSFLGLFTIPIFSVVNNQTAPAHCATILSCSPLSDTPIFTWDPIVGADNYVVYLATDSNFTNIIGTFSTPIPRYTPQSSFPESQAGEAIYWYVKACSSTHCGFGPEVYSGAHPPISAFRKQSKKVNTTSPGIPVANPQPTPPAVADQITFSWEDYLTTNLTPSCTPVEPPTSVCPTQEAESYRIDVSDLADFSHIIDSQSPDDTFYTAYDRTYPEGPLYWRVRAVDHSGNNLTLSDPRILTKKSSPLTLTQPANNANVTTLPVFQWNPQNYAVSYELEVYKNPGQALNLANRVISIGTGMTAWTPTTILPPGQYGWRVRRYDAGGNPGPWSAIDNTQLRLFTFGGISTTLIAPADNAIIPDNNILYQWQPVAGASYYQLQSSTASNFSSLFEGVTTASTAWAPQGVYPDGKYYWRVVTLDANSQPLTTSAVRSFTRGIPPISEPLNVSATAGNAQATVTWTAPLYNGGKAIDYYEVSSSPGGILCNTANGSTLNCTVTGLTNGQAYTFRVRAHNADGFGPYSLPSNSVTPTGPPTAPLNVTAAPGNQSATVNWNFPANGGGLPITGYTVTSSPGGLTCSTAGALNCTVNGLTNGTSYTFTVKATNSAGPSPASAPSNPVTPTTSDYFHAITPARILDSRPSGPQVGPYSTPWGQGVSRDVQVGGQGGVPMAADAVILNVTVTNTTANSFLTIWPAGTTKPLASSLNWVAGQTVPNAVTVKLGAGGMISVYNPGGNVDVIIDVVGYYDANAGDGFTSLAPLRIQDSRPSGPQVGPYSTPWGPDTTRQVQVTNWPGVPSGATGVVLNVTVTNTTASSFLSIWPTGDQKPLVSSLNWTPGTTIANAVTVKVGTGGMINVYNPGGNVDVIIDIVGYFQPGTGKQFHPLAPARIQDSRPAGPQVGPYSTPWGAGVLNIRDVTIAGPSVVPTNGVPANADSVLTNVTVTNTTASSFLTIYPSGTTRPNASTLNWTAGQTVPNQATLKAGTGANAAKASVFNAGGTVHVIIDIGGYYL